MASVVGSVTVMSASTRVLKACSNFRAIDSWQEILDDDLVLFPWRHRQRINQRIGHTFQILDQHITTARVVAHDLRADRKLNQQTRFPSIVKAAAAGEYAVRFVAVADYLCDV